MANSDSEFDEEDFAPEISVEQFIKEKNILEARCKAAGIDFEVVNRGEDEGLRIGLKSGRDTRWFMLWAPGLVSELLAVDFENYVCLAGLEAICSYADGTIEALLRPLGQGILPISVTYRRLFGINPSDEGFEEAAKIILSPAHEGLPHIEIGLTSQVLSTLLRASSRRLTLKLSGCQVTTHDSALALLNKVAGAVLFQLDLLSDVPISLERSRYRSVNGRRNKKPANPVKEMQYPKTQYDSAPMSLYWYARSAAGMPLLQFLAYYQVIEFYFPIYSQSEAQRKLRVILKDPTFRGDRDADIARLLSAIHVSRSGGFGDERSQLRATLMECLDSDALRYYLEEEVERKDFFLSKSKTPYHKIPLANPSIDLRNDVADRIYDIRCKIVHTKSDARDGNVELLLPFTPEAEQLAIDIELVQYLAQRILVASSAPFNMHG